MPISAQIRQLEQAFISPNMIFLDNESIDGVVTARRLPGLLIHIRPVEPPHALASLSISIDERDLAAVQKLIGEETQQRDKLSMAKEALHAIARGDLALGWQSLATQFMELAEVTVKMLEADDGTPSDS